MEKEAMDTGSSRLECSVAGSTDSSGPEVELFDNYGLAEMIAAITGEDPEAADEFAMYALIMLDGLDATAALEVKRALERSVRLAFQFSETCSAAFDLYVLSRRGMLMGKQSAVELIREAIELHSATASD
jgi:hypothetical protein